MCMHFFWSLRNELSGIHVLAAKCGQITGMPGSVFQCVTVCRSVSQCAAVQIRGMSKSVLYRVVARCSISQCVAGYCNMLQRVAACCSVLQFNKKYARHHPRSPHASAKIAAPRTSSPPYHISHLCSPCEFLPPPPPYVCFPHLLISRHHLAHHYHLLHHGCRWRRCCQPLCVGRDTHTYVGGASH